MASQSHTLLDTQAEMALKSQVIPGGNSAAGVGAEDHQGPVHFCQV